MGLAPYFLFQPPSLKNMGDARQDSVILHALLIPKTPPMHTLKYFGLVVFLCCASFCQGQSAKNPPSVYHPEETFAPGFFTQNGNEFRSASGAPGPAYWQNRADYVLKARIDTLSEILSCNETIRYTNNSPDRLSCLWLELDQNTYREDARSNYYTAGRASQHTQGFEFSSVKIDQDGKLLPADYLINDTRMQIRLPRDLASKGKILIQINYHYQIPGVFGGRNDFFATRNGKIFEMAQWYPHMCVYDDLLGWNTLPFLGSGEFYCEYGDFDYSITVPRGMIVAGSGELVNEKDMLTPTEEARLNRARQSDSTVMVRTQQEVNGQKVPAGSTQWKTWHFIMHHSRDVAFGASKAYMWDAARVDLPAGKKALAMSVYPVESAGREGWGRATEYLKKSIEYFSSKWFVYPYPVAVNEAGMAGGMEYPGIVFDGYRDKNRDLYWVTAHEIGHNWFPMIVGSDERRFAFMDEGFNTFIDVYASDNFNHGEYAPKRDGEYAPGKGNPADEIVPWLRDPEAPTMMERADRFKEKYRHPIEYFKPAFGLVLLREQILGPDRFDYAFRKYIQRWAYKHPAPDDFFRTMDDEAGEDLTWFWREWFENNWQLDLAVKSVSYPDNDFKKGASITLENLQKMVMPALVEISLKDGSKLQVRLPVETWLQTGTYTLHVPTTQQVVSVVVDPGQNLPDCNRENNYWHAAQGTQVP